MSEGNRLDEMAIVRQCIAGDKSSQELFYNRYAKNMMGICLGYSNNRDEAKDILQEGFIKVFMSLDKYKGEGPLEGWIRRIIVHTAVDYYRKNLRYQKHVEISDARMVKEEITVLNTIQEKELLALIQQLPEGARIIFNLYVLEGYKHEEIAELLQISSGTSKSQFSRAKDLLKEWVFKLYNGESKREKSVQNIY